MYVAISKPLFAWDCLQDSPSLSTIRQFLASIPDAKLLQGLRQHRGRGRNDCPVQVAWGVVLLRIALRHVSVEATLAELGRNEALRRLIGIEKEEDVPKSWNISRFFDTLGREPQRSELRRIFDAMVGRLGVVVPDLGQDTAGDSTALHARHKDAKSAKAEIAEGLPQPSGGKKEYLDDFTRWSARCCSCMWPSPPYWLRLLAVRARWARSVWGRSKKRWRNNPPPNLAERRRLDLVPQPT